MRVTGNVCEHIINALQPCEANAVVVTRMHCSRTFLPTELQSTWMRLKLALIARIDLELMEINGDKM